MDEQRDDDPSDITPVIDDVSTAAVRGESRRRAFIVGAAAAAAAGTAAAASLARPDSASAAPLLPQTVDHKSGFVAQGGGAVNNGYGTNQPPHVNLATGVNVWGSEVGVIGNGATGVCAYGTPTGANEATGLIAIATPQGTADSTAVSAEATGKGLQTLGVTATARNHSLNAKAVALGVEGDALTYEGLAIGVAGAAVTTSHTQPATGVSGTATAALSSAIGVSGSATTENEDTPATGVSATAITNDVGSTATGVSATATANDTGAMAIGVVATASGPTGWGVSAIGPKGGRFASAPRAAQLNLVPQETATAPGKAVPVTPMQFNDPGPILPQAGEIGDFWFSMTGKPGVGSLWVCVQSATGTAPAQWSQVLLGQAFPGQAV